MSVPTAFFPVLLVFTLVGNLAALPKANLRLENETLALGFNTDRLLLVSIVDPQTGHEFIESLPEEPLLWRLSLENPDGTRFEINSAPLQPDV